jgi:succinyl-diaminopimelate desuccinylase
MPDQPQQRPKTAAEHLRALIACQSVTPADGGAQDYLAELLGGAGFKVERLTFSEPGMPDIHNLFASVGSGSPHLVFGGHTDVVPPGDEARWTHGPFSGDAVDGSIYGRGAVDMKGGIAAFITAALDWTAQGPRQGALSLAITGDEEGPAINGTRKLLDWASAAGHRFDAAIVGEPTSQKRVGDTIKIGRRGSLSGTIVVRGRQGHVAYPHLADNPVPELVRILGRLNALEIDDGSPGFQASNFEVTGLSTDNSAFNVIPGEARARFNIRFNDLWSPISLNALLRSEIVEVAERDVEIVYEPNPSEAFLTEPGPLVDTIRAAIKSVTGLDTENSTGGGTSDARYFRNFCPVVEFGPVGDTMHQTDERIPLADLETLTAIYREFLDRFFGQRR